MKKIIEHINTPGQHVLLYGDRGVGKSSLANISTQLLIKNLIQGKLFTKRCDSKDSFASIVEQPLADLGVEVNLTSYSKSHRQSGKAGLSIPIASAGVSSDRTESKNYMVSPCTPSKVADLLKDSSGLLYIDEADQIASVEDKVSLAELIKLLSDHGSKFKIFVVGIAQTGEDLTGAHPSAQRCLKETKLRKMDDREIREIITGGSKKLFITFENNVISSIVKLSSGYPHFAHLLSLKCAEEAIAKDKTTISRDDLATAINSAVQDAEGTLSRKYEAAIRSHSTDMYRIVLFAASRLGRREFTAAMWRSEIQELTGDCVLQSELNNYLNRLVSDDESSIITRMAKGVYKFVDPRMPSYVRIANKDIAQQ
ncbi:AAA family ATPase [Candidatus Endoriftia persephone]|uniref:RNA helicase domain-containing protein n=1 Tax=Candidatus Endoriftia persephonae TaxID=393765 RepID=A0A9J6ZUF5_9GAMM|nr:AAA family ATPase [Candidatus Endoriftia persephone]USF86412.1 RNA helicase domain-containing protein [Candidatus Endoriftia persephone]